MRPRVLYVGGEDHHLRIPFLLAMRERGHEPLAAGSGDGAPFAAAGIPFHPWRFGRFLDPLGDLAAIRRLARLVRDLDPDVAQGYDTKPCIYLALAAAAAGRGTAVVRTICGTGWVASSGSPLARALRPVQGVLHGRAGRLVAATVFETSADADAFAARGIAGRGATVIPAGGGGIDVAGFDAALAAAPPREAMRAALGLAPDAEVVVTVSRLTRQKGIPALLAAAALVHRERPGAVVLLVGPREAEGPLAVPARDIDAHHPYVRATGARRDVPALLAMADVFAFPTEYGEGVPRVLLEATLAGLPLVATAMAGCREVVEPGVTGLLVPPARPEALARAILDLLADRARGRALQAEAERRVRARFGLVTIADRHAELYRGLLAARAAPAPPPSPSGLLLR